MKRRMMFAGIVVGVLIVIAAITVTVVLKSVDLEGYRSAVIAEVEAITGRKLTISGAFDLSLGLKPSIVVGDISLSNLPGASRPNMAEIERLEARIDLLALLFGDVVVERLVAIGADVLLEENAKGDRNWRMGAEREATGDHAKFPTVTGVRFERSVLSYKGAKTTYQVQIDRLSGRSVAAGKRLALDFFGAVNKVPMQVTGEMGALRTIGTGAPFPIDLKLNAANNQATVSGEIGDLLAMNGVALRMVVSLANLAGLGPAVATQLPSMAPLSAEFRIAGPVKGAYRVTALAVAMPGADVAGEVTIMPGKKRPHIKASLSSKSIDASKLRVPESGEVLKTKQGGRVFPDNPLPFGQLRLVDADITYGAGEVILGKSRLQNLKATAALRGGVLKLNPVSGKLSGGVLALSGAINAAKKTPTAGLKLGLGKANLEELLQAATDSDLLRGDLNIKADLKAKGRSVRELMATLQGDANMVVTNGYIANQYLELLAADLLTNLAPRAKDGQGAKVNCAIADFPVKSGIATAKVLLLDTERMTVTGDGTVNLATEKLKLQLKPKPKDPSLLSLATPVNIAGTLNDPTIAPDTVALATGAAAAVAGNVILPGAGLLLPLLSAGSDDKHPCIRAVAGAIDGKPGPGVQSKTKPKGSKDGGIGGILKGIGDSINKTIDKTLGGGTK